MRVAAAGKYIGIGLLFIVYCILVWALYQKYFGPAKVTQTPIEKNEASLNTYPDVRRTFKVRRTFFILVSDKTGIVTASRNSSVDTGCAGLDNYWAQISTDPTFTAAYYDSLLINGRTIPTTKSTNASEYSQI